MFALAPGRLSTITGCFSASESGCPMVLATISTAPPAAYGTTILIGRLGYGSPCAVNGASNAVPSKKTTRGSVTGTTHFTDTWVPPSDGSGCEAEQLARRVPQQLATIGGIRKQRERGMQQHAVVDVQRRAKVRPVRRPKAMVEGEGVDQRRDERQCIVVQRGLARKLHESGELDEGAPRFTELEQRPKA